MDDQKRNNVCFLCSILGKSSFPFIMVFLQASIVKISSNEKPHTHSKGLRMYYSDKISSFFVLNLISQTYLFGMFTLTKYQSPAMSGRV